MRNVLPIAAIVVTIGALWLAHRPVPPREATWADVTAESEQGGYRIITTEALWQLQGTDRRLLVVDTRQPWEYRAGHIRGAANFPMEPTWWARWRKARALERFLGPDKERAIVFY